MNTIRTLCAAILIAASTQAVAGQAPSPARTDGAARAIVLKRDPRTLLFTVPVRMGDVETTMIVDTGASLTMLTPADAAALGGTLEPQGDVVAAGITGAARVTVSRTPPMTVAGIPLGTRIVATAGGAIGLSLLGQKELKAMGRITIEDDVMTIRPPAE